MLSLVSTLELQRSIFPLSSPLGLSPLRPFHLVVRALTAEGSGGTLGRRLQTSTFEDQLKAQVLASLPSAIGLTVDDITVTVAAAGAGQSVQIQISSSQLSAVQDAKTALQTGVLGDTTQVDSLGVEHVTRHSLMRDAAL